MNDFTKDELIDLRYYTRQWHEYNKFDPGDANLIDKLSSMIENYCEHSRMGISEPTSCLDYKRNLMDANYE